MTTDTPTDSARDLLSRPFNARLPEPMTPDFAQMLLDARTTRDGALELRQRAVAAALAVITEARDGREQEVRLTTLAQLVAAGRLDEARAMAADLLSDRAPTLDGAEFTLKAGRATLTTRAWPFLALAEHLARLFESTEGAVNYVEHRVEHADPARPGYLMTMQRAERPTPHELRRAAEERAKVAEERLEASRAEVKRLRAQIAQSSERGVPWLSQAPDAATVKAHAEAHPWHEVPSRESVRRIGLWQVRWREKGQSAYGGTTVSIAPNPEGTPVAFDMTGSLTPVEKYAEQLGADSCEWRPLTADHEPICDHLRAIEREAAPLITIAAPPAEARVPWPPAADCAPGTSMPDDALLALHFATRIVESVNEQPTQTPTHENAQSSEHTHAAPAPAPTPAEIAPLPRRRSVVVIVRYPTREHVLPGSPEERFAAVRVAARGGSLEPAGGKVEDGESAYDAATREAFEELGVQVEVDMRTLGVFEHVHNGCIWHCHAFVGQVLDPQLRGGREGEALWVTRAEIVSGAFGPMIALALAFHDDRFALPSCI